ncbi:MAG TPA: hypothetical protein VKH36_02795 [Acidimicrobiia bacterium]|nr:hypothetical protein [Acidimicrobiia bacterium]
MATTAPPVAITFERTTHLAADAGTVWRHVTTPRGINDEFKPWMRMTVPQRLRDIRLDDVELGVRLCRSWVLILGFVAFEYDDLVLVERGPGMPSHRERDLRLPARDARRRLRRRDAVLVGDRRRRGPVRRPA